VIFSHFSLMINGLGCLWLVRVVGDILLITLQRSPFFHGNCRNVLAILPDGTEYVLGVCVGPDEAYVALSRVSSDPPGTPQGEGLVARSPGNPTPSLSPRETSMGWFLNTRQVPKTNEAFCPSIPRTQL
jgi:hypothetical protein